VPKFGKLLEEKPQIFVAMNTDTQSGFTVTQRRRVEDALHFARKHEQRVWGSGNDHEKARAEVERLEAILKSWPNVD
jgi:hypothetical protein